MKLDFQQLKEKTRDEVVNIKNSINLDVIKYIDRKILIGVGTILFIVIALYYYYIFFVYSPGSNKSDRKVVDNIPNDSQQIINKQATTSFYSSMKPNTYSNVPNPAQVGADIYKIPANYMDISSIPVTETDNYVKTFDIIYDYLKEINGANYQNALLYLNKDFVAKNKITADVLANYHKDTYFPSNTFIIKNVVKTGNIYATRIFVGNKSVDGVGFFITYKLTEVNDKLDISIDDLEKYIKQGF